MKQQTILFYIALLGLKCVAYDATVLISCSNSCPTGCQQCSNSTCSTCLSGYTYISATSSCSPNTCTVTGCSACDASGVCLRCTDPYQSVNAASSSCVENCPLANCAKCLPGALTCQKCADGYALYKWDGSCRPTAINNCLQLHDWRKQEFQCSLCKAGYRPSVDQTECIADGCSAIADCQSCPNSTICSSCRPGFSFDGSNCTANLCSVSNCLYCSASNVCLRCSSGFALSGSGCAAISCTLPYCAACKPQSSFCDGCTQNYVYNVWSKQCEQVATTPKPLNCERMSRIGSLFVCLSCLEGFTFADANKVYCVRECPSNCLLCSSASACTTCKPGYSLNSSSSCSRIACPVSVSGCALCNETGSCIQCTDSYALFDSASLSCTVRCAIANCRNCKAGSTTCEQCHQSFALSTWTNACVYSVIKNCKEIHDWRQHQFQCSQCLPGYRPTTDLTECIPNGCASIADCESCTNSSVCLKCRPGFSFSGGLCSANPCSVANCLYCNSGGTCLRSSSSYYMVGTQLLLAPCSLPGCAVCNLGSSFCSQCSTGFTYDSWSGKCKGSPSEDNNLNYLWFLIIIVILISVAIVIKLLKNKKSSSDEESQHSIQAGHTQQNSPNQAFKDTDPKETVVSNVTFAKKSVKLPHLSEKKNLQIDSFLSPQTLNNRSELEFISPANLKSPNKLQKKQLQ